MLDSVKPSLYSHGSAVMATVQQLAGAVGTALFISVATIRTTALAATGGSETAALADAIRAAFTYGEALFLAPLVAAFFVR